MQNEFSVCRTEEGDGTAASPADNNAADGNPQKQGVEHPDIVGTGDVSYSINFWVTANGLVPGGGTVPEHYLKGDDGWYVRDEEGNLIEIWSPDEELVFFNAFHISLDEVCKKLYTWHQSTEQQSTEN